MKTTAALVLALATTPVWASVDLNQKINLDLKKATVGEVLDEIAKQTKVDFVVSISAPLEHEISIQVKGATLKNVMNSMAKEEGVKWRVEDAHSIKISMIPPPPPPPK